jgi:beta-glucosidase
MTSRPHPSSTDFAELIDVLDLKAKVRLLTGSAMCTVPPEESIGLAELRLSDGPTGVRGLTFTGGPAVALLPNATLIASAWSEDVAHEAGRILAEEAMAKGIHIVLGPTINLHRSMLGGRLFEAYSEDPYLSGRLAAAYVRGLQGHGVGACLKHLVANESETERHAVDSVVDEATLREVYLLPFEMAVADADPWMIMAAYNDVNGVACTEHDTVINRIVKGEWGWTGLIVSDWWATRTTAASANGGLDLVMPGPAGPWGDALVAAVSDGEVAESVVDEHLRRLLRLAERVGALGNPREHPTGLPVPDSPVRKEQLTRVAAQGMTVLRNENAALPLARGATVALIGRHALETVGMGGGSARVTPPYQVSVAEGLSGRLGSAVSVVDGVEVRTRPLPARPGSVQHPGTGAPGIQATLLREDGSVIEDRYAPTATTMVGIDDDLSEPVVHIRLRARVRHGGRLQLGGFGVGQWAVRVAGEDVGRFELRLEGSDVGEAVLRPPVGSLEADVAPGEVVEATVDLRQVNGGNRGRMPGAGLFGLVASPAPRDRAEVVAAAVDAAREADVAVVVVGHTEEQETEAIDKTTIRLPGDQDDLVRAVAAAARRTVVVVNAATPVIMPWLEEVDAVLLAGLPGQEGGHAVAAALLGDIEPAGRLVTTWPAADGAAPAWSVTPVDGRLVYEEGPFVGYRGHEDGRAPAPAFWLGHGLGYTTWDYADARVIEGTEVPGVSVTVANTGERAGREVVQVYLRPADPAQPVRLAGWEAVTAAPGESVTVDVPTDPRLWRRWNVAAAGWDTLPIAGQLLVARGLGDVRATLELGGG